MIYFVSFVFPRLPTDVIDGGQVDGGQVCGEVSGLEFQRQKDRLFGLGGLTGEFVGLVVLSGDHVP